MDEEIKNENPTPDEVPAEGAPVEGSSAPEVAPEPAPSEEVVPTPAD